MNAVVMEVGYRAVIEVDSYGGAVALEINGALDEYVDARLTPSQAVDLSRALVHAAAEALGAK